MRKGGALSMDTIRKIVSAGEFIASVEPENIRPGSLDLRTAGDVYRVNASFLPCYDESVMQAIKRVGGFRLPGEKALLERGVSYAVKIEEKIHKLPRMVYGYNNPKSSSGRVDAHVRGMVDRCSRYDVVSGSGGDLWLLIVPKKFSLYLTAGISLNQLRLFDEDTRFDELDLEVAFDSKRLLYDQCGEPISYCDQRHSDRDGSVLLSLGLNFDQAGFQAKETREPIDLNFKEHYDPREFFREIDPADSITIQPDNFYILSSMQYVRVPADLACEMRPMDERSGEHRSHYAGFIDPGWGIGKDGGGRGRPLTLEVRTFDSSVTIQHGQPIAKIRYERMREVPSEHYDQMAPTYGEQSGPKLAKNFKAWK